MPYHRTRTFLALTLLQPIRRLAVLPIDLRLRDRGALYAVVNAHISGVRDVVASPGRPGELRGGLDTAAWLYSFPLRAYCTAYLRDRPDATTGVAARRSIRRMTWLIWQAAALAHAGRHTALPHRRGGSCHAALLQHARRKRTTCAYYTKRHAWTPSYDLSRVLFALLL